MFTRAVPVISHQINFSIFFFLSTTLKVSDLCSSLSDLSSEHICRRSSCPPFPPDACVFRLSSGDSCQLRVYTRCVCCTAPAIRTSISGWWWMMWWCSSHHPAWAHLKSFFEMMGVSAAHAKELLSDNGAGTNPNWNTATTGVNFLSVRWYVFNMCFYSGTNCSLPPNSDTSNSSWHICVLHLDLLLFFFYIKTVRCLVKRRMWFQKGRKYGSALFHQCCGDHEAWLRKEMRLAHG